MINFWRWLTYSKPLDGTWRDFFPDWKMVYTRLIDRLTHDPRRAALGLSACPWHESDLDGTKDASPEWFTAELKPTHWDGEGA